MVGADVVGAAVLGAAVVAAVVGAGVEGDMVVGDPVVGATVVGAAVAGMVTGDGVIGVRVVGDMVVGDPVGLGVWNMKQRCKSRHRKSSGISRRGEGRGGAVEKHFICRRHVCGWSIFSTRSTRSVAAICLWRANSASSRLFCVRRHTGRLLISRQVMSRMCLMVSSNATASSPLYDTYLYRRCIGV